MGLITLIEGWAGLFGMAGSDFILIFLLLVGFVFFAFNIKMGLIYYVISLSCAFILFYFAGWETIKALILLFLTIVLMALTLYGAVQTKVY